MAEGKGSMPVAGIRAAVIGLGYVGLPVACALDEAGFPVIGYDIDAARIEELKKHKDRTGQHDSRMLAKRKIAFTADPAALRSANFLIVTAPTPIDKSNRPDLTALEEASAAVGENLSPESVVVFESTVYPGVTEEICLPLLERRSGLKCGRDFYVGYCPERINPGDNNHTLDKVVKVVSASHPEALEKVSAVYSAICPAGLWKASSIRTAEAAKVIENIQRDLNIALMNELSLLFRKLGISMRDVLEAASTKWNFHRYTPGLVGGHCIGVDPYYLTYLAETVGHHPQLILAGRRINDQMAHHVVDRILLGLARLGKTLGQSKVLILGVTFKENVPDTRNSKVFPIITGLKKYGLDVRACDPLVEPAMIAAAGALPAAWPLDGERYDAALLAVRHRQFESGLSAGNLAQCLCSPALVVDLKWMFGESSFPAGIAYETL